MYEFFVLSELMDRPFDGYKLKKMLEAKSDSNRKISFGMIYPLLNKLADNGWITLSVDNNDSKRSRKVAQITETGRQRFFKLVAQPVPINQNSQLFFEFKFGSFHLLNDDLKAQILLDYQHYLTDNLTHIDRWIRHLRQIDQLSESDLQDAESVWQLRRSRFEISQKWAENQLKTIQ